MIGNAWMASALCVALGVSAIVVDDARYQARPAVSQSLSIQPPSEPLLHRVADRDPLPLTPRAGWKVVASKGTAGKGKAIWAHLASYRSRARAMKGWAELRKTHYPLLEGVRGPRRARDAAQGQGCLLPDRLRRPRQPRGRTVALHPASQGRPILHAAPPRALRRAERYRQA